jgi:hypothetical protein
MNKVAKIWVDNDNLFLHIEVKINGEIKTHDEWGQYFNRTYIEKVVAYYFGNEYTIQYM